MAAYSHPFDRDLLSPAFLADPYPYYRQLREAQPVFWSERLQAWALTRYADVQAGLSDPRLNSGGRIAAILGRLPDGGRGRFRPLLTHMTRMMSFSDPPDHTRLRKLIGQAFTPRMVRDLKPKIQAVVDELLDALAGQARVDVVGQFAFHLPAIVICELLGIPRADRALIKRWSDAVVGFVSAENVTEARAAHAQAGVAEATEYLVRLAGARRRAPQADLISALVAAEDAGDRLTADELVSMCVLLFFAGFETTEGLIGNGLLALLRHPQQMRRLRADPALIEAAVEEFLRYDSSVQRQSRVANEDFDLHGQTIRRGQYVLLFIGAANRDPARFPDPDRLDLARPDNKHVGFGHGIHFCVGGPLARVETQIAINSLLARLPNLRLAEAAPEYEELLALRKLKALWVETL
jgi:cytochrome P450